MKDTYRLPPCPLPQDEAARLEALAALDILDTPPERFYEDIVELAAQSCRAPIALISLVDADRQWFKAAHGLPSVRQTPRAHSFCTHAILDDELMLVEDALDDPRFRDNPLVVGEPFIRMYAGVPLRTTEGHALGTLCVVDRAPRTLGRRQRRALAILAGVVTDKLEARRQHAETANVRAQLAQILDNVPALISCRDASLHYRFVNRALAARIGVPPEDVTGRRPEDVLDPGVVERHQPLIARALAGETVSETEVEAGAGGVATIMRLRYQPALDAQGRIAGVYGFHQDVSDLVRMEDEIRTLNADLERRVVARTAELADAMAQLEMFSHAVAHDLRAPVRHLLAFADFLHERAAAGDVAGVLDNAARMGGAAQRLAALVEGLQRLTHVSNAALSMAEVDLAEVVGDAWATLAGEPAHDRAELVVGPLPRVRADRVLLTQAFVNLLGNALKFSARRERPRIEVAARSLPDAVALDVRDNGVGFAGEHAPRLFRPFARLHAAGDFAGTGVELAIVERIVRRHGGSVHARAAAGSGAAFTMALPAM